MKKILYLIILLFVICNLTGCKGQAQADYGNTEDYKLPNVTRIVSRYNDTGYNYLIDNNTGVVYLEYSGANGRHAITVMFNKDGTLMKEKDIRSK